MYEQLPEENLWLITKWVTESADMDWNTLVTDYRLTEEFIHKQADKVNWMLVSQYQRLSEQFIEQHEHLVDWYYIGWYQLLSAEFIIKHLDLLDHLAVKQKYPVVYREYELGVYYDLIQDNRCLSPKG